MVDGPLATVSIPQAVRTVATCYHVVYMLDSSRRVSIPQAVRTVATCYHVVYMLDSSRRVSIPQAVRTVATNVNSKKTLMYLRFQYRKR